MTFVLVVFGAIVGALSTGGASLYADWRHRRDARRVAARLILGDLYLAEGGAEAVLSAGHWANIEWGDSVERWRESREPLAASVLAADWVTVDNAFRLLGRVVARATREADQDTGKLGSAARRELEFLREAAGRARTIVLPHTGTEKELVELTNVVKQQVDEEFARQLDR